MPLDDALRRIFAYNPKAGTPEWEERRAKNVAIREQRERARARRLSIIRSVSGSLKAHSVAERLAAAEKLLWRTFQFGQQKIAGRNRLVSLNDVHDGRRSIAHSIAYDDPLAILCALESEYD